MNENLNLRELLKDCPKGTKLYSPAFGEGVFEGIVNNEKYPIQVSYDTKNEIVINLFTKNGYLFFDAPDAECMLFPSKEQRDWSKWHRPFKNGDIITSAFGNIAIFSHFKKNDKGRNIVYYHCLYSHGSVCKFKTGVDCGIGYVEDCRLATEHEKDLMMDALIKNGYRWNKITKTVEKINHKSCLNCKTHYSMHQNCPYSPVYRFIDLNDAYLHMNDDANCEFWTNNNLVRKFGIGEKVVEITSGEVYEVADITDKGYFLSHYNLTTFSYQYKLVKFEEEDEFDTIMYFTKSTCNDRKTEINVRCECTSSVSDVEDSDDVPGFFL